MKRVDMTGQRYWKLTVIRLVGRNKHGQRLWECLCDCGQITVAPGSSIRYGSTKSCGCGKYSYQLGEKSRTHGMSGTRTYRAFHSMLRRCTDTKDKAYASYGGRGITICDRWIGWGGFENFYADMGECPDSLSLERMDVNGNYEPENCKWATTEEQANNKRNSRFITWKGQTRTITAWCSLLGHNGTWLAKRLKKYSFEKAMEPFEYLGKLICPHCGESFLSTHLSFDTNAP